MGWSCSLSFLLPPSSPASPRSDPSSPYFPDHALLSQANTPYLTLGSVSARSPSLPRSHACHSGTRLFHPASRSLPSLVGFVHLITPVHLFSLSLCLSHSLLLFLLLPPSLCPTFPFSLPSLPLFISTLPSVWLCLPHLTPVLLGHSSFLPPLSAWPFLQGSLHLAHLSLPSSLRVSGAAQGALAPAPALSLLSPLLSWKVQSPRWLGCVEGEAGVCCELLLLNWPGMPAS